jgi:GMP synthase-like glutamine amidotransferase
MRVHCFQHVPYETLGFIETWCRSRGYELSITRWYAGEKPPDLTRIDMLIVLGGPMSVHDVSEHPWLVGEKEFLAQTIEADRPILGICLGAQLLAERLGASVRRMPHKEIGWFPIRRVDPAEPYARLLPLEAPVFHWHGETFDIPVGAVRLAESDVCTNQAFVHRDRILALQFHLEMTWDGIKEIIGHVGGELVERPTVQSAKEILSDPDRYEATHPILAALLDRLAAA